MKKNTIPKKDYDIHCKYNECTNINDPNDKHWCSTATNPRNLIHISGNGSWGLCEEQNCPYLGVGNYFPIPSAFFLAPKQTFTAIT